MEDENMQDMSFPDGFEDVTSEYTGRTQAADDAGGTSAHAKTAGKKGVRGIFTPDMIRKYAPAAGYFLFCAVFSGVRFALETYPFGFALLCAAEGPAFVIAALAGLAVGTLFVNGGVYIAGCALVIVLARCALSAVEARSPSLRTTVKSAAAAGKICRGPSLARSVQKLTFEELMSFTESIPVRCALASAAAVVCGGVNLMFRQNIYRAAAAVLLSAAVCPLLTAAYSGLFVRKLSRVRFSYFILAVIFSVSWALRDISVLGFSLGAAFALAASLWGAWALNLPEAFLCAFCAALPLDYAIIPAVLLATGAAAVIRRYSSVLAALSALITSLSFACAAVGLGALSAYGTEFIAVCAICAALGRLGLLTLPGTKSVTFTSAATKDANADFVRGEDESSRILKRPKEQLRSLSECFNSLSTVAASVAHAVASPSESELRERVARAFDRTCASCREQSVCWSGEGYGELSDFQKKLTRALKSGARPAEVEIPPELEKRCPSLGAIVRAAYPHRAAEGELGTDGKCRVFADDWHAMGEVFSDVSEKLDTENTFDKAASRRLRTSLALLGVEAKRVAVYGERLRRTELTGVLSASLHIGSEELRRCTENALGVHMSEPQIAIEGDSLSVTMQAQEKYRVSVGRFLASAKVGICGDSVSAFAGGDGYFRAMISDGMGSGNEAAFTSGTVTMFLEHLLSSGVKMKNAISIVNSFLRERRIESSATVDIMELDLIRGGAQFVKSGAAPSFVLRQGRLFKLRSRTVPIGILPSADAEMISFAVKPGDIIVMMSDGVTQTNEDCPWLYDILCTDRLEHLTASAKRIADEAAKKSEDDISVMLIRVEEA